MSHRQQTAILHGYGRSKRAQKNRQGRHVVPLECRLHPLRLGHLDWAMGQKSLYAVQGHKPTLVPTPHYRGRQVVACMARCRRHFR